MATAFIPQRLAREIADALGLQNVRRLELTFDVHEVATARATFFPEEDALRQLPPIVKQYSLTEQPLPDVGSVTVACDSECLLRAASWPGCCKLKEDRT